MRNKSLLRAVAFVLIMILMVPLSVAGAEKIPDARGIALYQISGDTNGVSIKRGEKKTFRGSKGTKLGQGDTVTTNGKTQCYLTIDQDKIIKMDKSTILKISRASSKKLRITLESGNLYFDVKNPIPGDSELEFKSGGMVMGVRGTNGFFGNQEAELRACILTGEVELILSDGQRVVVKGGFYQVVKTDGIPDGQPRPITAEEMTAFVMETVLEEVTKKCETETEKSRQEQIKELFQIQSGQELEEFRKKTEEKMKEQQVKQSAEEAPLQRTEEELKHQTQNNPPIYGEETTKESGSGNGGNISIRQKDIVGNVTMNATEFAALFEDYDSVSISSGVTVTLSTYGNIPAGKTVTVHPGGTLEAQNQLSVQGILINNSDTTLKLGLDSFQLLDGARFENNGSLEGSTDGIHVSGHVTMINQVGKNVSMPIIIEAGGNLVLRNEGTMNEIKGSYGVVGSLTLDGSGTMTNEGRFPGAQALPGRYTWTGERWDSQDGLEGRIGTHNYSTLESALAAATTGQTVLLLRDCSKDALTVKPGVCLEIPRGTNLTVRGILTNNGTVAVNGGTMALQKSISSDAGTPGIVYQKGTMTVAAGYPVYDELGSATTGAIRQTGADTGYVWNTSNGGFQLGTKMTAGHTHTEAVVFVTGGGLLVDQNTSGAGVLVLLGPLTGKTGTTIEFARIDGYTSNFSGSLGKRTSFIWDETQQKWIVKGTTI